MVANLPIVEPAKLTVPVLMLRGEYDGIATMEDLVAFYQNCRTGPRVRGAAGNGALRGVGINRQLFWHAMHGFLAQPHYGA